LANGKFSSAFEFAQRAAAKGYRWAALEYNDFGNEARVADVRDACRAHDLVFTIWLTRPFDAASVRAACLASQAAGVICEAEIPGFVDAAVDWPSVVGAVGDLPISKAVVTNFAAFVTQDGLPDPSKSKPLVDAGWACMPECHLAEAPNATPENGDFYARAHLGWTATQPLLGMQGGKTFADFPTRDNYANWSVWDAGEVL
jgi:hypothetical protein